MKKTIKYECGCVGTITKKGMTYTSKHERYFLMCLALEAKVELLENDVKKLKELLCRKK